MKIIQWITLLFLSAAVVRADNIYVGESVGEGGPGYIGKYTTSGKTNNATLITGLVNPRDIKITASGNLLVICAGAGTVEPSTIGLYTTAGTTVNASLTSSSILGLFYWSAVLVGTNLAAIVQNTSTDPAFGLAVNTLVSTNSQFFSTYTKYSGSVVSDGSFYYVNDTLLGHLQKFNLDGSVANYTLATMAANSSGMAIDGTNIYVTFDSANTVGKYSTSGKVINATLITGLNRPESVAADGHGHIFVVNNSGGSVGEYTTDGAVVNAALISGLSAPWGIAVDPDPNLTVTQSNRVMFVAWPATTNYSSFFLQTNASLATTNWVLDSNVTAANSTNTAALITHTNKQLFFRLESTNGF